MQDDPIKPGSFRNRKSSAPENNKINLWKESFRNRKFCIMIALNLSKLAII